jgi:hypothetical protein
MASGGESAHVQADLGDDHLGGGRADTGDLIESVDRGREREDLLVDLAVQGGDVGADPVHPGQHPSQQERVVGGEVPGERFLQHTDLASHSAVRHLGEHLRVPLPGH